MFERKPKKVLITGSTQGIGKAIAEAMVKEGYSVIVHCSKDIDKAESVRAEIGAYKAVVADLSNMLETESLKEKTGDIDILIANASVQFRKEWFNITEAELDLQMTVNFKSTFKMMQLYYSHMKMQKWGRIITIGSVQQYKPHKDMAIYAASKCAVMSFVENIAKQVAVEGITVNNISPGVIHTPRNTAALNDEAYKAKVMAGIPMGVAGESGDCVGAVLLLCSEKGRYITGTDIIIDGGMRL